MELQDFLAHDDAGRPVAAGSPEAQFQHVAAQESLRVCAELNSRSHAPEEVRALFGEFTGRPAPDSLTIFPPTLARTSMWARTPSSPPAPS
ncbi:MULTISPECIES: hypothetical protein [Corynebacterium]|uniref:hypothetical protein n=1 Tax=Corynebacterium TaxID=1716 RepID=UPI000B0043B7|nr:MULTISPECIES: hypothetical protein [Corynebacterium]